MTRQTLVAPLLVGVFLAGCKPSQEDIANGDDPIRSLSATAQSTRYGPPYWAEQRRVKSASWQQAVAYCTPDRSRELPNCQTVSNLAESERGNTRADSVLRSIGESAKRPIR